VTVSTYEQQHEVEQLKAWWKNYGAALIVGVVLGLVLLFGNKYWQQYREEQRVLASELYQQLLTAQAHRQAEELRAKSDQLMKEHGSTPYAALGALVAAQTAQQGGDVARARQLLEWVVKEAADPASVHAARLRLGRLLVEAKEYDAALALIQPVKVPGGFEAEYLELKGDILLARERRDEARAAYREALKAAGSAPYSAVLQMKLDELGPETVR
jgi:predicted negative regulator of RcsB-dependent stress response